MGTVPTKGRRGRWKRSALWAVVVPGVVLMGLWAFQRQLIYFPDPSAVPSADRVIAGARDVTLRTSDGLDLGAWFVPAARANDRSLAVLIAPGNGGNRADRAGLAEALRSRGFAILLLDYRGYGGNPGTPSEQGLARDADAAVARLSELGYPPARVIYLGESLGTGVVAALASRHRPAGLVLRSPFTELADVGAEHYPWLPVRLLLRDRFPVLELIRGSDVPLVVIRGRRDSIVPARLSAQVAAASPALVDSVVLDGDHNHPSMFGPRVADAVARLADSIS